MKGRNPLRESQIYDLLADHPLGVSPTDKPSSGFQSLTTLVSLQVDYVLRVKGWTRCWSRISRSHSTATLQIRKELDERP